MAAALDRSPATLMAVARALDVTAALDLDRPAEHDPAAVETVRARVSSLGLPSRLRDVGIAEDQCAAIATEVVDRYPDVTAGWGDDPITPLTAFVAEMW